MTLCDTHIHVVDDPVRCPMIPSRTYTPHIATIGSLRAAAAPYGITRFVVVQPSFYGTDNTVALEALSALGANGVGVAVVDTDSITEAELRVMAASRVRGLRINLYSTHGVAPRQSLADRFAATTALCERMDWHVQVIAPLPVLVSTTDMLAQAPVHVVIDHYGLPGGFAPDSMEGGRLLDLVRLPHLWVKLSAPYRSTGNALAVAPDAAWLAALLDTVADRCVWGSDWPHTPALEQQTGGATPLPYRPLEYGAVVAGFRSALPDRALADLVMSSNPAKLYRFDG